MRVGLAIADLGFEQVQVRLHAAGGLAVVGFEKLVNVLLDIRVGIPEQLGQDIGAQGTEFAVAAAGVIALLEKAFYAMLNEELHIGLQRIEIRKRLLVMTKIRRVIPN